MAYLPVRRDTAPPIVRTVVLRVRAAALPEPAPHVSADPPPDRVATDDEQAVLRRQQAFDQMTALLAEQQREANALRDLEMAQLKHDDETLKKWIAMI